MPTLTRPRSLQAVTQDLADRGITVTQFHPGQSLYRLQYDRGDRTLAVCAWEEGLLLLQNPDDDTLALIQAHGILARAL